MTDAGRPSNKAHVAILGPLLFDQAEARDITTHDAHRSLFLQRRPCRLCEAGPLVGEVAVARSNPPREVEVHQTPAALDSTLNRLMEMRRREVSSARHLGAMRLGALEAPMQVHRAHIPRPWPAHSTV